MNENSLASEVLIEPPDWECVNVAAHDEREQWIKRFKESGLSIRKFSATYNIPRMTLWRWVKSAQSGGVKVGDLSEVQFTEIQLPAGSGRSDWVAELALADGTVLRLTKEVPAAMLEQLLRVC